MDLLRLLRRRTVAVGLLAVLLLPAYAFAQPSERQVQAAFLYNFTRFVEWPQLAPRAKLPFHVCVLADQGMRQEIERTIAGESVQQRPMVVVAPQTLQDARRCEILFVGGSETARAKRLLAAVRDLPVLTVGDSPAFLDEGGVIQFRLVDGRVRFDVNLHAAGRASLKVSSNLLRVARDVKGGLE